MKKRNWFLWVLLSLLVAHALAYISDPSGPTFFFVLSYIPSIVLSMIAAAYVSYQVVRGRRWQAWVVTIAASGHLLLAGDFALRPLYRRLLQSGDQALAAISSHDKRISIMAVNAEFLRSGSERIADFLRTHRPQVVLFSEFEYDVAHIASLRKAFAPYRLILSSAKDTAIATTLDVVDSIEIKFPTRQPSLSGRNSIHGQTSRPQRSFLHARLEKDGQIFHVLPVRFIAGRPETYGLWDQVKWGLYLVKSQRLEVSVFADYVRSLQGPIIFGGDLNATHSSQVVSLLSEVAVDTDVAVNGYGHRTFKPKVLPFLPPIPMMRLDYVFASRDFKPIGAGLLPWSLSDHNPLITTVEFADGAAADQQISQLSF